MQDTSHYQHVFNNMGDGLAVYSPVDDGDDFVFVDLNPAGQLLSRIRKCEALGERVTSLFPSIDEIGLLDVFRRVCKTGNPERLSLRLYRDERIEQWVENYVFRLPNGHICALYSDTTNVKKVEVEAISAKIKVQELARKLSLAREAERQELADILHDGPAQLIAISTLLIERSANRSDIDLEYPIGLLRTALSMLRLTVSDLFPQVTRLRSLEESFESLAEDPTLKKIMSVSVHCNLHCEISKEARSLLYKMSREFLINAVKHGRAEKAVISAEDSGSYLSMYVEDNGVGFCSNTVECCCDGKSYGLSKISRLCQSLGGELILDFTRKKGALVGVRLPIVSLQ